MSRSQRKNQKAKAIWKMMKAAKDRREDFYDPGRRDNILGRYMANQQEDGDGLMQNILANLCEESRKVLTEWLREFKQIDNQRALEVGHLSEGLGSFVVRRPKGEAGYPEVRWARGGRVSMSTTLQRRGGVFLW